MDLAFLVLFKRIVLGGDTAQNLVRVLAKLSREDTARVFLGIVRLWLEFTSMHKNDAEFRVGLMVCQETLQSEPLPKVDFGHETFFIREKDEVMKRITNVDTALNHMLKFATDTAHKNTTVRLGMLDGGSLALVLTAFANAAFKLSSLTFVPRTDGKKGRKSGQRGNSDVTTLACSSLAAINTEASSLSVFMHSAKFKESWKGRPLNSRLSLCSSLVDSLLGRDEIADEGYEVTRALFRKIVTGVALLE